jgi:hypothetical protein
MSRISEDNSSLSNGSTLAQSESGACGVHPEKRRWRYELDWENKAEDEEPILVQKVGLTILIPSPTTDDDMRI